MSRATNDALRLPLAAALILAAAAFAWAQPADNAPAAAGPAESPVFAPAPDNATIALREDEAARAERDKRRRNVMKRVAVVSLVLILVLICFVVVVMILTRRMRIRYLHYDRKVTFGRLWDVWWGKDDRGGKPRKE